MATGIVPAAGAVAALSVSGQTPAQAPPAPSPGAGTVGSAIHGRRTDDACPSAGVYAWYGTGADGSAVLDGTATFAWASKSGSTYTLTRPVHLQNLTINSGVILDNGLMLIDVAGTLSGAGTILAHQGRSTPARFTSFGYGGATVAGGTGVGGAGLNSNDGLGINLTNGNSGSGGTGTAGAGGAGTHPNSQLNNGVADFLANISSATTGRVSAVDTTGGGTVTFGPLYGGASGGAGAGDSTNSGGASGAGGGVVIVNARILTGSVTISADGGAGTASTAGNTGGGGGGNAGAAILNTTDKSTWTGTLTANGGLGGAGHGTGTTGGNGTTGLTLSTTWV